MEKICICIIILLWISLIGTQSADKFYGSPLVLDAACENRDEYISLFTVPDNIVTVEGPPHGISTKLAQLNETGL